VKTSAGAFLDLIGENDRAGRKAAGKGQGLTIETPEWNSEFAFIGVIRG